MLGERKRADMARKTVLTCDECEHEQTLNGELGTAMPTQGFALRRGEGQPIDLCDGCFAKLCSALPKSTQFVLKAPPASSS